jgi:DNA-binding SARP family transcriptional activator
VSVRTLGRFTLEVGREALRFDGRSPRRVLELLKCIVAFGADGVSCDAVAAALWPDADGDAARRAFEITVHRLRKVLGNGHGVRVSHGTVWLDSAVVWVDAVAFEAFADRAIGEHGAVRVDAAHLALALYGGPFLQNEAETAWLLPRRDRLRSRYVRLATGAAQQYERSGDLVQATDVYAKALEFERLSEDLHRRLIVCLARQGRRAEAIVAYQRLRKLLEVVLRTVPSQETEAAYAAVVRTA